MKKRWAVVLSLASSLGYSSAAWGQTTTYTWNDPAGGNFHNSTNWTPSGVPVGTDIVNFTLPNSYTVTYSLNGSETRYFAVRNGNVTFTYNNPTANHLWYESSFITPLPSDTQNTATLNIVNSTNHVMTLDEDLQIGPFSGKTGTLNINNNGRLQVNRSVFAGSGLGGTGNINISTTGSTQNSSLTASYIGIGYYQGTGIATVSGMNASLQTSSLLDVGLDRASGSLAVSNGGLVSSPQLRIGFGDGSNNEFTGTGTLSVTGTDSQVNVGSSGIRVAAGLGNLAVSGSVSVSSGSRITSTGPITFASEHSNRTGYLTVAGSNALMQSNQSVVIGVDGTASANVAIGGRIEATGIIFGQNAGSDGHLLLQSIGSTVHSNGGITIGSFGTGQVNVVNGGQLSAETTIGVGRGNLGTLNITGGTVISDGGSLGFLASGNGQVTVSGLSSSWNAIGDNDLLVGNAGQGTMNIISGGSVSARVMQIGNQAGSVGSVTVQGVASTLTTTEGISIGTEGYGVGTLAINANGTVDAGDFAVLYSTGNLQLNGGSLHLGNFFNQGGNFTWNAGTVNFNRSTNLDDALVNSLLGSSHMLRTNQTLSASGGSSPPVLTLGTGLTVDGGRVHSGGTLFISSGQTLKLQNGAQVSSTTGLTNAGILELNGSTTQINGANITNQGTIHGTGVLNAALINSTGQVEVAAGQRLTLAAPANSNAASIQMLGGILDIKGAINNQASGFISGYGTIKTSTASPGGIGLVNSGTIALSGGNTSLFGDVDNRNSGRIITTGGSVTTFHDDVIHNGAEIRTSAGSYSVFFGQVSGAGPFTGSGVVQFEGDLRPGNSPANVQFAGNLEFSVTSRLIMEVGGLLFGSEHDRLTVQGQVTLDGQLEVSLLNGFTPLAGNSFILIDNQGVDPILGTFAGLSEGSSFVSGGQLWSITYQGGTGNDVMLFAVPEPTTWALMGMATLGAAGAYWYRRRQQHAGMEQEV